MSVHPVLYGLVLQAVVAVLQWKGGLGLLSHKALRLLAGASLGNGRAAICEDKRPGHEARLIGRDKREDVRHLLRRAAPAEDRSRQRLFLHLRVHWSGLL